jgi:hypothetical protein
MVPDLTSSAVTIYLAASPPEPSVKTTKTNFDFPVLELPVSTLAASFLLQTLKNS